MTPLMLHYDPRLVEDAVFYSRPDPYVHRELDEQRSRIYEMADADERDQAFAALYRGWFDRLGVGAVIEHALREQPSIAAEAHDCFVLRATLAKDESAELFVATERRPDERQRCTVRLLIRPEILIERETALAFLRYELFHIADMLDPTFGYEPTLPKTDGGPTYEKLVITRYRVLWDVTIHGRMVRRGWLPKEVREQQLGEFRRTFPMLEERTESCFGAFFDSDRPGHAALSAFALDPRAIAGPTEKRSATGTHCSLCRFPTHSFEPEPGKLPESVLAVIRRDFPQWTPARGLCRQCADLYRARELSSAAALTFPGAHSC